MIRSNLRHLLASLAAAATLAIAAPSAGAAWTQVTTDTYTSLDEVGVVRTPDGILHVLWRDAPTAASPVALMHSAFDPSGNPIPGSTVPVTTNWSGMNGYPDIVYVPGTGTLVAIWAGLRTLGADELNLKLVSSVGTVDGLAWSAPIALTEEVVNAHSGAGLGADADPRAGQSAIVTAWGDVGNGYTFGPAFPIPELPGAELTHFNPEVAIDAETGAVIAAWRSLLPGTEGTFAAPLGPTAPLAEPLLAPGSQLGFFQDQRTAITALQGGPGVYLAYAKGLPTKQLRLWRFGAPQATALLKAKRPKSGGPKPKKKPLGRFLRKAEAIGIAKADAGRLWIFWARHNTYYATRVKPTATKVKKLAKVKAPQGTTATWRLTGEGSAGGLDLFAMIERNGVDATWHTQIKPKKLKKNPK